MAVSHGFNKTEAATSVSAPVKVNSGLRIIVGTAPINKLEDPEAAVNTPLLVNSFKEAATAVGYSADFAKYTICDAMSAGFQVMGVSPAIVINVLDPAKHSTAMSAKTVQVNDGVAEIEEEGVLPKKLVVKKDTTALTADVDYTASFNDDGTVSIALVAGGKGDGATTLSVSGSILDPDKVTAADIVGGVSVSTGKETGLEVIRQVFPKFGMVPGILLAPRFSKDPLVTAALQAKCRLINGVFDAVCFIDIDSSATGARKYTDVYDQKVKQGATSREAYAIWLYGKIGETVYSGSSLAAAAAVYNDSLYNDTPNASPSNVSVPISSACLEDGTEVLMDQEQGNVLNEQGVATFIRSGDFVLWGNETCCYPKNTDPKDAFLCVRRFFNHAWAEFVLSNQSKLDKPMNKKRLQSIVDSENMKGSVYVSTEVCASYSMKAHPDRNTAAELVAGHYSFYQYCTPFPPFKQVNNTMEYEAGALTSALSL